MEVWGGVIERTLVGGWCLICTAGWKVVLRCCGEEGEVGGMVKAG